MRSARWLVATVVLSGCGASLSSVQPARLTPASHLAMTSTLAVNAPVGSAGDTLDALRDLDGVAGVLEPAEIELLANAVNAGSLNPPVVDPSVTLAYGVNRFFELGARVGGSHVGAQARVQVLRVAPGIYGALGLQVSTSLSTLPINRFNDRVFLERYRRLDVGIPLIFGYSASRVHLWAGPKLLFSRVRTRGHLCVRENDECADQVTFHGSGSLRYVAGQLGIAVGKRRFWIALELTLARLRGDGQLRGMRGTTAMSFAYDPSGRVIQPALGLIAWF
ncbi:MAG: hypothetical protein H6725_00390 [Sandaracinaceae bacterium]|nr:hypothetical protein [Sandaracinaceae bacterium]